MGTKRRLFDSLFFIYDTKARQARVHRRAPSVELDHRDHAGIFQVKLLGTEVDHLRKGAPKRHRGPHPHRRRLATAKRDWEGVGGGKGGVEGAGIRVVAIA